jgi:predicted Zn-dependent peptidase
MNAYEFQQAGILMTFLCCAPEETAGNLACIQEILEQVQREGVSEAELTRAQSKFCSQVVLQGERPANRLFSVGGNWIQRREYRTVRDTVESYRAVTCRQIRELLDRFPLTAPTPVAVGPLEQLEPPPRAG